MGWFVVRTLFQKAAALRRELTLTDGLFALLRFFTIGGGLIWLAFAPLAEKGALQRLLWFFATYTFLLYLVLFFRPAWVKGLYLGTLAIDLAFTFFFIRFTGGLQSDFYLIFYLLVALHAFYFGLKVGLLAALAASGLYISAGPLDALPWTTSLLRLFILWVIAGSLGLLAEWGRRAQEEVGELRDYLKAVVETISDGIVVLDLEGRVTIWNRAMAVRYGISAEAVMGRRFDEAFPNLGTEEVWEQLHRLLAGEVEGLSLRELEHQTLTKEKAILNVEGLPLRDGEGRLRGAVLVIEDITERLDLERQIRRSEKLAAIGQLASGLAHEVGTPLGIIVGQADRLIKKFEKGDPVREGLERIRAQADRITRLVQQLLAFARRKKPESRPLDLSSPIKAAADLLIPWSWAKGVSLTLDLPEDLPKVRGDSDQLQQVFLNLFLNALQAIGPSGGQILVTAQVKNKGLRVGSEQPPYSSLFPPHFVEVAVADTGCGIPLENLGRVFEPFFTTKEVGEGTGLGLAVCHGIVQDHGGWIEVESEVGKGSTFRVFLPVHREEG